MRKNRMRLTESQLQRVIKESVKNILNEDASNYSYVHHQLKFVYDYVMDCKYRFTHENPAAYEALKHLEGEVLKTIQVIKDKSGFGNSLF